MGEKRAPPRKGETKSGMMTFRCLRQQESEMRNSEMRHSSQRNALRPRIYYNWHSGEELRLMLHVNDNLTSATD